MSDTVHIGMINLTRAADRRALMTRELARAGLGPYFHTAFDSTAHPREAMLAQCRTEGPWGVFNESNMAITISHAQVWEAFLQSDATHCLVMEDDIHISPDLGAWLDDLSWWPEGADMVKIERWRARRGQILMGPVIASFRGRALAQLYSRHVGAAGYMLTRDAATRLLAQRPFSMTIDNFLFNFNASRAPRRMNVFQVMPALVQQGNEPEGGVRHTARRSRPTGLPLLRQKIRRGWSEIAYPLPTILKALTGRATLRRVSFEPTVNAEGTQ